MRTGSQESYRGIYLLVTLCIVILDMLKLSRLPKRRYIPVQLPQPLMECGITRSNITNVALEMLYIDWVESNDRSVEANVCFGNVSTEIVRRSMLGKVSFGAVEGGKEGFDGFLISFLRSSDGKLVSESYVTRGLDSRDGETSVRSKARFVDSVVDVVIGPTICPFNLCSQFLREEINNLILVGDYVVEFRIEHADDLAGLNVDVISSSTFLSRRIGDAPHC